MRDQREPYEDADYQREHQLEHDRGTARYRDEYESDNHRGTEDRFDSHYDEGEDPVAFVNVIDMDIPFFQLVWLIFKIMLATLVAAGIIYLLGMLLQWILALPQVQQILPDGSNWLNGVFDRF